MPPPSLPSHNMQYIAQTSWIEEILTWEIHYGSFFSINLVNIAQYSFTANSLHCSLSLSNQPVTLIFRDKSCIMQHYNNASPHTPTQHIHTRHQYSTQNTAHHSTFTAQPATPLDSKSTSPILHTSTPFLSHTLPVNPAQAPKHVQYIQTREQRQTGRGTADKESRAGHLSRLTSKGAKA